MQFALTCVSSSAEAVDRDFLSKNPSRMVKVPANLREVDKTTLSWEQLRAALAKLSDLNLRDCIPMKIDMSNALRPSELFPLHWRCFDAVRCVLDTQETICKGKMRSLGKMKGSLTKVPIARRLAKELVEWRNEVYEKGKDTAPDAFIFPVRFGGPMDSSNFRHHVLHKLAEASTPPTSICSRWKPRCGQPSMRSMTSRWATAQSVRRRKRRREHPQHLALKSNKLFRSERRRRKRLVPSTAMHLGRRLFVEWFWNLRQGCDKVAEGRCF